METVKNKQSLMLELQALVKKHNPEYEHRPELVYASIVGILSAVMREEDLQKAVDLWSEMGKDK